MVVSSNEGSQDAEAVVKGLRHAFDGGAASLAGAGRPLAVFLSAELVLPLYRVDLSLSAH